MARSSLCHIRVASLDELKQRILKGIDESDEHPDRHADEEHCRWDRED